MHCHTTQIIDKVYTWEGNVFLILYKTKSLDMIGTARLINKLTYLRIKSVWEGGREGWVGGRGGRDG